jgi:subtilisin family serine protease
MRGAFAERRDAGRAHARPLRVGIVLGLATGAIALVAGTAAAGSTARQKPTQFKALTPTSVTQRVKTTTSRIAKTDPTLLGRGESTPVNVMIKYDFDATASYKGGVEGLAATSPRKTGKSLRQNPGAVQAYEAFASQKAGDITSALVNAVPAATVRETYKTVYGGVEARVPANAVSRILAVPGVLAVQKDVANKPTEATGAEAQFIGAANAWSSLGGSSKAGDGVIVGVIDTGIWPEHPSFAGNGLGAPAHTYPCAFGASGNPDDPSFACNNKLIGAYAFTQTYQAVVGAGPSEYCVQDGPCSTRDSEGHGTHTASTAAGDPVASAKLYGVERGPISGVAPGAKVIAYRVCLSGGCFSSDSIHAVQQAILDDVDVINYSISGGNSPYTDSVELAFLNAFDAGISVNASAGNEGPGPATVAHASPWVTSVGASSSNRFFVSNLHLADGVAIYDKSGVTITDGIADKPVVVSTDTFCANPAPAATYAGKVVVCARGAGIGRIQKGFNVMLGGAVGMILYNPTKLDVETDNHFLPAIHLEGPNPELLAFLQAHPNAKATWATGVATATRGDVMAAFSSRGPAPDFLKPDVTAPGIQVLAGMTPKPEVGAVDSGKRGELYQAIAGTSMSGPHSAGASALVKAAHPEWSPAEIKSALMTSSVQDVVKEDGSTPADPFDMGAGSIRVDRALNPTVVFDETYANYVLSIGDPLGRINLNLPSIDAPTMPGTVFTNRTVTNVSGRDIQLNVGVAAPAGASIVVNGGKDIRVRRGGDAKFGVIISAPNLPDGQYFGRITLDPRQSGLNPVTIPVAFNKQQGSVDLLNSCSPTTFVRKTGKTHCTVSAQNFNASAANVRLLVEGVSKTGALTYSNIQAPAGTLKTPLGFLWQGQLSPALPPEITGIDTYPSPYATVPVGTVSGMGDETIANFDVPAFRFGNETYDRIGVDSNGYAVVGGMEAADNNCCDPAIPDAARPNNVLAPFWTDLDLTDAGAVHVAMAGPYIVIDWAGVPRYGTSRLQSFQIWIQTAALPGEYLAYDYGAVDVGPAVLGPVVVGAENRDGSSGQTVSGAPVVGTEYSIIAAGPTAGGSISIDYDASSAKEGVFSSVANLTSDITPGVTQQVQTLTVTK